MWRNCLDTVAGNSRTVDGTTMYPYGYADKGVAQNDESCIKNDDLCIKTMNFVLKMHMDTLTKARGLPVAVAISVLPLTGWTSS